MTLLIAGTAVLLLATAVVVRAILRDRQERLELQARHLARMAYHARRSQEIRAQIDAMGDEAEHLFPPARNGGRR